MKYEICYIVYDSANHPCGGNDRNRRYMVIDNCNSKDHASVKFQKKMDTFEFRYSVVYCQLF